MKINEKQLRTIIRESINRVLNESGVIISKNQMGEGSNVYYGQDKFSYFAADYLANTFRRFPNERQAKAFAEELYKQEQIRKRDGLRGVKFPNA